MKVLKFIGFASLGVFALYVINQLAKAKTITFDLISVKLNRDKLSNLLVAFLPLRITANIKNPTQIEARIKGLKVDVFVNDVFLGTIVKSFEASTKIQAQEQTQVVLDFDVDLSRIGKTLRFFLDYFQGLKPGVIYLRGYIESDLGTYQINQNYPLNVTASVQ